MLLDALGQQHDHAPWWVMVMVRVRVRDMDKVMVRVRVRARVRVTRVLAPRATEALGLPRGRGGRVEADDQVDLADIEPLFG